MKRANVNSITKNKRQEFSPLTSGGGSNHGHLACPFRIQSACRGVLFSCTGSNDRRSPIETHVNKSGTPSK